MSELKKKGIKRSRSATTRYLLGLRSWRDSTTHIHVSVQAIFYLPRPCGRPGVALGLCTPRAGFALPNLTLPSPSLESYLLRPCSRLALHVLATLMHTPTRRYRDPCTSSRSDYNAQNFMLLMYNSCVVLMWFCQWCHENGKWSKSIKPTKKILFRTNDKHDREWGFISFIQRVIRK